MGQRIRRHVVIAAAIGLVVGFLAPLLVPVILAPSLGWIAASTAFLLLTWVHIWPFDAARTEMAAASEAPNRTTADVVILAAAVLSLATVGLVLFRSDLAGATPNLVRTVLGVVSVVLAWTVVHTVFTLRYARMYYGEPRGGIDFNTDEAPAFSDFAYVAFGIGMAFQVADTNISTREFRAVVLRHALLSFVFATTIVAVTINLVASLNA